MKLENVEKVLKISISKKELEKYTTAINGILCDITEPDFTEDYGTLKEFFERLISIVENVRDY